MAARLLLDFLLPSRCVACPAAVDTGGAFGLCQACRDQLRRWRAPACRRCGVPLRLLDSSRPLCGDCLRRPPAFDRLLAGWIYRPPLDAVLRAVKFRGRDALAAPMGRAVARLHAGSLQTADLIVPVPLHWRRRLRRGFDQSSLLARAASRQLGIPCRRLLHRRRATPPQARRPRAERVRGLHRAFGCQRAEMARGRRIVLVDDVVTTTATVRAAAAALQRARPREIVVLAVARTPIEVGTR